MSLPREVYLCFSYKFLQCTAIISLLSIHQLIFLMEAYYVIGEVLTEYIMQINYSYQMYD